MHGHLSEGQRWLEALPERIQLQAYSRLPVRLLAQLLQKIGTFARYQGRSAQAIAWLEQSVPLFRQLGDQPGLAWVLANLGTAALARDNFAQGGAWLEQALTLYRELGDRRGLAFTLSSLGWAGLTRDRVARGEPGTRP
jgi:tetratricopeptide (TPR) repeat protein